MKGRKEYEGGEREGGKLRGQGKEQHMKYAGDVNDVGGGKRR